MVNYFHQNYIHNWQTCIQYLSYFPSIDKITVFTSSSGWSWYNFFWVRSSYVKNCEYPLKTERRWYYEDWLARKKGKEWQESSTELAINSSNYQFDKNFLSMNKDDNKLISIFCMKKVFSSIDICQMGEEYTC